MVLRVGRDDTQVVAIVKDKTDNCMELHIPAGPFNNKLELTKADYDHQSRIVPSAISKKMIGNMDQKMYRAPTSFFSYLSPIKPVAVTSLAEPVRTGVLDMWVLLGFFIAGLVITLIILIVK